MGIDLNNKKEQYKYLSSAPVFVNQTDHPTYKIWKILTNILDPLAIKIG